MGQSDDHSYSDDANDTFCGVCVDRSGAEVSKAPQKIDTLNKGSTPSEIFLSKEWAGGEEISTSRKLEPK